MGPRAGVDILKESKTSYPSMESNPELSSSQPNQYTKRWLK